MIMAATAVAEVAAAAATATATEAKALFVVAEGVVAWMGAVAAAHLNRAGVESVKTIEAKNSACGQGFIHSGEDRPNQGYESERGTKKMLPVNRP